MRNVHQYQSLVIVCNKQKLIRTKRFVHSMRQFFWGAVKFFHWLVTRFKWFWHYYKHHTVYSIHCIKNLNQNKWIVFIILFLLLPVEWSIKVYKSSVIIMFTGIFELKRKICFHFKMRPHTQTRTHEIRLSFNIFRLHCNHFHVNFPFHWISVYDVAVLK